MKQMPTSAMQTFFFTGSTSLGTENRISDSLIHENGLHNDGGLGYSRKTITDRVRDTERDHHSVHLPVIGKIQNGRHLEVHAVVGRLHALRSHDEAGGGIDNKVSVFV